MAHGTAESLGTGRFPAADSARAVAFWRGSGGRILPITAALGFHAILLWFLAGAQLERSGMDHGEPDAVTIEVLDNAAFDARYPAIIANKPQAESKAQPPSPPADATPVPPDPTADSDETVKAPPLQARPPAKPAAAAVQQAPSPTDDTLAALQAPLPVPQPKLDLTLPATARSPKPKARQMTAAEFVARQLGGSARERLGQIDDFTRAVARQLDEAKPVSKFTGQVVISFVVSASGAVQNLQITRSSGNADLDQLILLSVRGLQVKVPPAFADSHDRTFEITYDYQP